MALPAPHHIAQLSAGGTFKNGLPSGPYDCAVAVGAMALDAYTGGAIAPSAREFRHRQNDQDHNGIGLADIAVAWKAYGQKFDHGSHPFRLMYQRLLAGNGIAVPGRYANLGTWRAPGSSFFGPHMLYLQRASAGGVVVNDPLRTGPVTIPTATVERFYSGSAGYGHGIYVGDTTGAPTAGQTDAGKQLAGVLAGMGLTDRAHVISQDEAFAIAIALQGGIRSGYTPQLAGGYANRTVGWVLDNANASLIPDIPGAIAGVGQAVGDAAVGAVVNVAVLGSIIGLTYMGLKAILTSPTAIGRP